MVSPHRRARLETRLRYLLSSGVVRRRALIGAAGLVILGAAWIIVTGVLAHRQAGRLESRLVEVRILVGQGRIADAQRLAQDIPDLARQAHHLTTGPAWWLGANLPFLGDPLHVIRGTAAAGDRIGSETLPLLVKLAPSLDPTIVRTSGNQIDIRAVAAAAPQLQSAAAAVDGAVRSVDRLPSHTWLHLVDAPAARLDAQLSSIKGYVDAAANLAQVLPSMLGATSPKRYFVGLQNEAEMRGTGGLPGAFAIVVADHGRITFTHFESDSALLPAKSHQQVPTKLDFGKGYNSAYGTSDPTSLFVNSNLSPNFPYAAQIWSKMWQQVSGEKVDGAVALDPATLSMLLAVTGPVTLPNRVQVSADNIVSLTEKDEYAMFSNNDQRKAFLVSILKSSATELTSGRGSASGLARAMSSAAAQGRLLVWSADPAVESVLSATSYGAAIPQAPQPFGAAVLNNIAAGKLDYYLDRSVAYHRSGCGSMRDVLVTITLTNNAPAAGLPPYVNTRLDTHAYPVRPGDNRTLLDYYATSGAQLLSATLNGKPTTIALQSDLGHPIFRADLELPRGTSQILALHLSEPAGTGDPVIWRQAGVNPVSVTYYNQHCG